MDILIHCYTNQKNAFLWLPQKMKREQKQAVFKLVSSCKLPWTFLKNHHLICEVVFFAAQQPRYVGRKHTMWPCASLND